MAKLADGPFTVRLPTGVQLSYTGQLYLGSMPGMIGQVPYICTGDQTVMLDPRAFIVNNAGATVYAPRAQAANLPGWVTAWLAQHLEWDSGK